MCMEKILSESKHLEDVVNLGHLTEDPHHLIFEKKTLHTWCMLLLSRLNIKTTRY